MVKYKGRKSLKQYMPMKPMKSDIKIWCRADSTNEHLCEFDFYNGKSPQGIQTWSGILLSPSSVNIKSWENGMPFSVIMFSHLITWWKTCTWTKYSAVALTRVPAMPLRQRSHQNNETWGHDLENGSSLSTD